jgi:hypothetical protein
VGEGGQHGTVSKLIHHRQIHIHHHTLSYHTLQPPFAILGARGEEPVPHLFCSLGHSTGLSLGGVLKGLFWTFGPSEKSWLGAGLGFWTPTIPGSGSVQQTLPPTKVAPLGHHLERHLTSPQLTLPTTSPCPILLLIPQEHSSRYTSPSLPGSGRQDYRRPLHGRTPHQITTPPRHMPTMMPPLDLKQEDSSRDSESPGEVVQRAHRTCEKCTRTKKKCDKALPSCSRCTR